VDGREGLDTCIGGWQRFCFLNTDLANPTSNNIHQKIGYQPVCDGESWEFDRPTPAP
jgi:hypothetical protein